MLRPMMICFCVLTATPFSARSTSLDHLSDHARTILVDSQQLSLDSFTVIWHDSSTGNMALAYQGDLFVEILHETTVISLFNPFGPPKNWANLYIEEEKEYMRGPWRDIYPEIRTSATLITRDSAPQVLWSIADPANRAELFDDYYVTSGWTDWRDYAPIHRAHRLRDGTIAFVSNAALLADSSTSAGKLYFSVHTPTPLERPGIEADSQFVALVHIADKDSVRHTLEIRRAGKSKGETPYESYTWDWSLSIQRDSEDKISLVIETGVDRPVFELPIVDGDFVIDAPAREFEFRRIK